MLIDRKRAAELGRDTVQILQMGHYQSESGGTVEVKQLIDQAAQNTRSYPPDAPVAPTQPGHRRTRIEVKNETTLTAARRLAQAGRHTAALNFASAKNPGGGFLGGARAQEESLARSSGLFACLEGQPMYEFHRKQSNAMYSDYAIYSPDVPVFRTDEGALLDQPYLCSFITCAAVNAKVVLERAPSRRSQIREVMRQRIARVLSIVALHNVDQLILGAWGCGAFGNDSQEIAQLFKEALQGSASGNFEHIVFAITDWSDEKRFIGPFYDQLLDQH
jgi:uncharacterized protein (TIGR02452 family)